MKNYIHLKQEKMIIAMDNDECLTVIDGKSITSDYHCLDPEAGITVSELGTLDPTYEPAVQWGGEDFVRNLGRISLAVVGRNFDLHCYVPKEVLRDSRIAAEQISLADILIFKQTETADSIRNMFPVNGLELRFTGFSRHYDWQTLNSLIG